MWYIIINDVTKAMLIVLNMEDVATALTCIVEMIKEGLITVNRTKDRFSVASQGGWRDNLINFTAKGSKHIGEVQIAHSQLVNARAGLPGHLIYGRVRNALELVVVAFGNKQIGLKILKALGATAKGDVALAERKVATLASAAYMASKSFAESVTEALGEYAHAICMDKTVTLKDTETVGRLFSTLAKVGPVIDDDDVMTTLKTALVMAFPAQSCVETEVSAKEMEAVSLKIPVIARLFATLSEVVPQIGDAKVTAAMKVALAEYAVVAWSMPMQELSGVVKSMCADIVAAAEQVDFRASTGDKLKLLTSTLKPWQNVPVHDFPSLAAAAKAWDVTNATYNAGVAWFGAEPDVSKWAGVVKVDNDGGITALCFSGFKGLTGLPEGICGMNGLTVLDLAECSSLTTLPSKFGDSFALEILNLWKCTGLTKPPLFQPGKEPKQLFLGGCTNGVKKDESLKELKKRGVEVNVNTTREWWQGIPSYECDAFVLQAKAYKPLEGTGKRWFGKEKNVRSWAGVKNVDGNGNITHLDFAEFRSNFRTLPDGLCRMVNLISLDLSRCSELASLPAELGQLANLKSLNLTYCGSLESLPDLSHLLPTLKVVATIPGSPITRAVDAWIKNGCTAHVALVGYTGASLPEWVCTRTDPMTLDLTACDKLKSLPSEIGQLINLASLNLSSCEKLTSLPSEIGELINLVSLNLRCCEGLESLPSSFAQLINLVSLNLGGSYHKSVQWTSLPSELGQLVNLASLDLTYCRELKSLPDLSHRLPRLKFQAEDASGAVNAWIKNGCTAYVGLVGYTGASLPEWVCTRTDTMTLDLTTCRKLTRLPFEIGQLINLASLDLSSCEKLKSLPPELEQLLNLALLNLSSCENLTSLPLGLGQLVNLASLDLSYCKKLKSLPSSFGQLVNLASLDLRACGKLKSLPDISHLLPTLKVELPYESKAVDAWGKRGYFATQAQYDEYLKDGPAPEITGVSLRFFASRSLPAWVTRLTNLATLDLRDSEELESLPSEIGQLINLASLDVRGCRKLKSFPDLSHLLPTLKVAGCVNWEKRGYFATQAQYDKYLKDGPAPETTGVYLRYFAARSLPAWVTTLINLATLDLRDCEELKSLPSGIGLLVNLKSLDLSDCSEFTNLPSEIGQLINLVSLNLNSCRKLQWLPIPSIGQLINLASLNLSRCTELIALPSEIGQLVNLVSLDLHYCKKLTSLPSEIGQLANLTSLDLSYCSELTTLPSGLGQLVNLTSLDLNHCRGLEDLPSSFGKLANLTSLKMIYCNSLKSLPDMSHIYPTLKVEMGRSYDTSRTVVTWIKNGCTATKSERN